MRIVRYGLFLLSALTLAPVSAVCAPQPQAQTASGIVAGETLPSGISVYKGIPFAAPPVGDLRWRAPQPPASWSGVRPARAFGHVCMQPDWRMAKLYSGPTGQSEDCLYLNVWTPASAAKSSQHFPVMVWIYGGAYNGGSGSGPVYDGTHLAQKGVVVVTFNYRLGALGFLAHPALTAEAPYHSSGNYGMLDQVAVLKWVRDNIAAFGGDPDQVTIFGQSAGSFSVSILQASPLAKGLFQRAIGESGSFMKESATETGLAHAEQAGAAFAKKLGADSLSALRALPAETFVSAHNTFRPVEKDGYLLPDTVQDIMDSGRQNAVPLMVGANGKEERTFVVHWPKPTGNDADAFARFYSSMTDPKAANDTVLWHMWSWAEDNVKARHPAYLYVFRHWPPTEGRSPEYSGPTHGSEMAYVFGTLATQYKHVRPEDTRLSDILSSYWTNFAKTGNPNGAGLPQWPQLTAEMPKVMTFEHGKAQSEALPHADALAFLDAYFAKLRK